MRSSGNATTPRLPNPLSLIREEKPESYGNPIGKDSIHMSKNDKRMFIILLSIWPFIIFTFWLIWYNGW